MAENIISGTSGNLPPLAKTPPAISRVSPGNINPKSRPLSAKITAEMSNRLPAWMILWASNIQPLYLFLVLTP
jgi:hypothetical protein